MNHCLELDFDEQILNKVAKGYNTLDYIPRLLELLKSLYPAQSFRNLNKFELHQILNQTILVQHNGESSLKYALFHEFAHKKLVAAFEMKVNSSRVDFITINGCSTSFEIKSSRDNLHKLSKQANDYLEVFEYNNIVVHERHLLKSLQLVPECFGIWIFKNGKKEIYRKGKLNSELSPQAQLSLLTKKELITCFNCFDRQSILHDLNPSVINSMFKEALKTRYRQRWTFIVSHQKQILPIDLQFFFNSNILPDIIYS